MHVVPNQSLKFNDSAGANTPALGPQLSLQVLDLKALIPVVTKKLGDGRVLGS